MDDSFSVSSFAAFLHNNVGEIAGEPLSLIEDGDDKGMQAAEELTLGYYLVLGNGEALCNLTTVNKEARITDKNDIPFDKVDDAISAEIGQKVHYTITGKVPNTSGYTEYVYKVTDTMSEGLTFDWDSVKVEVGTIGTDGEISTPDATLAEYNVGYVLTNATLKPTENGNVQTNPNDTTNGFELTINVIALNAQ